MNSSPSILQFRRMAVKVWIERLLALLDENIKPTLAGFNAGYAISKLPTCSWPDPRRF